MNRAIGPRTIEGLREVVARYDAFLVDQFGVLHDGASPYPGAVDALIHLRAAAKRVVLLSNSGKRAAANAARLERLGFPRQCWTRLLTSGEVGWSLLSGSTSDRRRRCLLLARDGDRSAIDGLPLDPVERAADCELVLIAGSQSDRLSLEDYAALLEPAASRDVPALCTNPDKLMLTPGGVRFGAGRIGELYEELGGRVTWIGKPFPAIYSAAREAVGDIDPDRILCIGDSVEHDIAGARAAGLDSCHVTTGIHEGLSATGVAGLYAEAGAVPDFVASGFRW